MGWCNLLRLGARRTIRNWKWSLAAFFSILVASTFFASVNVQAHLVNTSLLETLLDEIPADLVWRPSSSLRSSGVVPDTPTLRQWEHAIQSVSGVERTEFYLTHLPHEIHEPGDIYYTLGLLPSSSLYDELVLVNGQHSLGVNETYVATCSARFSDYPIGSNYVLQFYDHGSHQFVVNATLRVVGYVELTDKIKRLISGSTFLFLLDENFLTYFIADYEQTFVPLLDAYRAFTPQSPNLLTQITIDINHNAVLDPYNVGASIFRVNQIVTQIYNRLPLKDSQISNHLGNQLDYFARTIQRQQLSYFLLAFPVLFIVFYMFTNLGDVTFSLRRREIGLLQARGGTPRQLNAIFFLEASIIGLIAGFLGLLASLPIASYFAGIGANLLVASAYIGLDTVLLILGFAVAIALFSLYLPARKVLKVSLPETLREYSDASRTVSFNKKFAWLCLGLGTYQLIIWIFGINISLSLSFYTFSNLLLRSMQLSLFYFNNYLGNIAPLLFTYGFITVVIKGSPSLISRIGRIQQRFFGDVGSIATHNVLRRRRRTAAILFLVTALVACTVQSMGYSASTQDLAHRRIYTTVGADLRVEVQHPDNVTTLLSAIRSLDGVQGATPQYIISMQVETQSDLELRAINVEEWLEVAYYEAGWFPSGSAVQTLGSLTGGDNRLVLEYGLALSGGYTVNASIGVRIWPNRTSQAYTVTGFFGPTPVEPQPGRYISEDCWSYTTVDVLDSLGTNSSFDSFLLVRLTSTSANMAVYNAIKSMVGVIEVTSAINEIAEYYANPYHSADTRIIQLVIGSVIFLTVTTTLITFYLGLLERRRITALMAQRGGSYRQLVAILAGEALMLLGVALLIGFLVGGIAYYGLLQSVDSVLFGFYWSASLTPYRFFPAAFIPTIVGQLLLVVGILLVVPPLITCYEVKKAQHDLSALR